MCKRRTQQNQRVSWWTWWTTPTNSEHRWWHGGAKTVRNIRNQRINRIWGDMWACIECGQIPGLLFGQWRECCFRLRYKNNQQDARPGNMCRTSWKRSRCGKNRNGSNTSGWLCYRKTGRRCGNHAYSFTQSFPIQRNQAMEQERNGIHFSPGSRNRKDLCRKVIHISGLGQGRKTERKRTNQGPVCWWSCQHGRYQGWSQGSYRLCIRCRKRNITFSIQKGRMRSDHP